MGEGRQGVCVCVGGVLGGGGGDDSDDVDGWSYGSSSVPDV